MFAIVSLQAMGAVRCYGIGRMISPGCHRAKALSLGLVQLCLPGAAGSRNQAASLKAAFEGALLDYGEVGARRRACR